MFSTFDDESAQFSERAVIAECNPAFSTGERNLEFARMLKVTVHLRCWLRGCPICDIIAYFQSRLSKLASVASILSQAQNPIQLLLDLLP